MLLDEGCVRHAKHEAQRHENEEDRQTLVDYTEMSKITLKGFKSPVMSFAARPSKTGITYLESVQRNR